METWAEKAVALRARLGREPTLDEYMAEARNHTMTADEVQAQRESWVRGEMALGLDRDEAAWRAGHAQTGER